MIAPIHHVRVNQECTAESERDRIGIFAFRYPVAYSPSIIYSAVNLAERGYSVTIFVDRFVFEEIECPHPRINVSYCTELAPITKSKPAKSPIAPGQSGPAAVAGRLPVSRLRGWLHSVTPPTLRRWGWQVYFSLRQPGLRRYDAWRWKVKAYREWFQEWLLALLQMLWGSWRLLRSEPNAYRYLIGVEPEGLMVAAFWSRVWRVPYYYHSLELFQLGEGAGYRDKLRKRLERWANQGAQFTVAQDPERAARLAAANAIPPSSIQILPVSEPGPAYTAASNVLHERLGIANDKKIALVLGAIYGLNMSLEIAEQVLSPEWPDDWVLVFHGFGGSSEYLGRIEQLDTLGRVRLSLDSVSFGELAPLVASASLGIALYRPVDANFELTVYSSGKIAQYLKCGLPIIVNDFPATVQMVERYGCGKCVSGSEGIIFAIQAIAGEPDKYRSGALRAFEGRYTFQMYFEQIAVMVEAQPRARC